MPESRRITVSGVVNLETAFEVPAFPVGYEPVRYGRVTTTVSGSGYNVARALQGLGAEVSFTTLLADDLLGRMIRDELRASGLLGEMAPPGCPRTPRSVVMHAPDGSRMVTTDLGGIIEATYPADRFEDDMRGSDCAVLTNVQFNLPLLAVAARCRVRVACDVHAIADLDDPHNGAFMAAADILFMSHERLPIAPTDWLTAVQARYPSSVIVIGLGAGGCLLSTRDEPVIRHVAARTPRAVVNTVGAGDALFAGFLRYFTLTGDADLSIQRAALFAGWKVGESGGSRGLLSADALEALAAEKAP